MPSPNLDTLPQALSNHAGYLLVRVGKHAQRLFSLAIEGELLKPAHCDVLFTLAEFGALSQVDIAKILHTETAHLVALLDHLERLGIVQRTKDAADRRKHSVTLTAAGVKMSAKLGKIAQAVEAELLQALSTPETKKFKQVLRKLAEHADEGD